MNIGYKFLAVLIFTLLALAFFSLPYLYSFFIDRETLEGSFIGFAMKTDLPWSNFDNFIRNLQATNTWLYGGTEGVYIANLAGTSSSTPLRIQTLGIELIHLAVIAITQHIDGMYFVFGLFNVATVIVFFRIYKRYFCLPNWAFIIPCLLTLFSHRCFSSLAGIQGLQYRLHATFYQNENAPFTAILNYFSNLSNPYDGSNDFFYPGGRQVIFPIFLTAVYFLSKFDFDQLVKRDIQAINKLAFIVITIIFLSYSYIFFFLLAFSLLSLLTVTFFYTHHIRPTPIIKLKSEITTYKTWAIVFAYFILLLAVFPSLSNSVSLYLSDNDWLNRYSSGLSQTDDTFYQHSLSIFLPFVILLPLNVKLHFKKIVFFLCITVFCFENVNLLGLPSIQRGHMFATAFSPISSFISLCAFCEILRQFFCFCSSIFQRLNFDSNFEFLKTYWRTTKKVFTYVIFTSFCSAFLLLQHKNAMVYASNYLTQHLCSKDCNHVIEYLKQENMQGRNFSITGPNVEFTLPLAYYSGSSLLSPFATLNSLETSTESLIERLSLLLHLNGIANKSLVEEYLGIANKYYGYFYFDFIYPRNPEFKEYALNAITSEIHKMQSKPLLVRNLLSKYRVKYFVYPNKGALVGLAFPTSDFKQNFTLVISNEYGKLYELVEEE